MTYCGPTIRQLIRQKGLKQLRKELQNINLETQIENISKYFSPILI